VEQCSKLCLSLCKLCSELCINVSSLYWNKNLKKSILIFKKVWGRHLGDAAGERRPPKHGTNKTHPPNAQSGTVWETWLEILLDQWLVSLICLHQVLWLNPSEDHNPFFLFVCMYPHGCRLRLSAFGCPSGEKRLHISCLVSGSSASAGSARHPLRLALCGWEKPSLFSVFWKQIAGIVWILQNSFLLNYYPK
jgi:hypothetical protein